MSESIAQEPAPESGVIGPKEGADGSWCLIESDPGVFTELIRGFGCTGAQVEEIWTLDAEAFHHLEPIHGLIFLFKWVQDDKPIGRVVKDRSDVFFVRQVSQQMAKIWIWFIFLYSCERRHVQACLSSCLVDILKRMVTLFGKKNRIQTWSSFQVITNACATQALLCLLMNLQHPDIDLGETLTSFKSVCQDLDPVVRGLCLSRESKIRSVHNSFARPVLFEVDMRQATVEEDVYHFVGFMPIKGRLYELDGMQEGPIELAEISKGQNWLDVVRPIIEARMQRYSVGEIHFNLMALVSDRQRCYERQIQLLVHQPSPLSLAERQEEIANLRTYVKFEQEKKRRYRQENQRRRHNYLPFIVELLKQLGETGQLMPIFEKAKKRAMECHLQATLKQQQLQQELHQQQQLLLEQEEQERQEQQDSDSPSKEQSPK